METFTKRERKTYINWRRQQLFLCEIYLDKFIFSEFIFNCEYLVMQEEKYKLRKNFKNLTFTQFSSHFSCQPEILKNRLMEDICT